jgi:hypothetical protein
VCEAVEEESCGGAGGLDDRSDLRIVSVLMVTTTKREFMWSHVNDSVPKLLSNLSWFFHVCFKVNWLSVCVFGWL